MYESILAGNLVLIDRMLDTKAFFYKGLENTNEYFVDSMEDVRHAIKNADTLIVSNIRDQIIRSFEEQGIKNRLHVLLEGICQDHR
jgi:hypothetical protein